MAPMLFLFACQPEKTPEDTGPLFDDDQPHIVIVSPENGDPVGTCFTMDVEVYNFEIVSPVTNTTQVDGQGHWHVDFGDRWFDCESLDCHVDITGLETGQAILIAALVDNLHFAVANEMGEMVEDSGIFVYTPASCQ